jgi:hypothetical protein
MAAHTTLTSLSAPLLRIIHNGATQVPRLHQGTAALPLAARHATITRHRYGPPPSLCMPVQGVSPAGWVRTCSTTRTCTCLKRNLCLQLHYCFPVLAPHITATVPCGCFTCKAPPATSPACQALGWRSAVQPFASISTAGTLLPDAGEFAPFVGTCLANLGVQYSVPNQPP